MRGSSIPGCHAETKELTPLSNYLHGAGFSERYHVLYAEVPQNFVIISSNRRILL